MPGIRPLSWRPECTPDLPRHLSLQEIPDMAEHLPCRKNPVGRLTALIIHYSRCKEASDEIEYLTVTNRIMLYPAVFLLTIGVFVGAVWANVSWGRYWGWDPKEVWALITMLVYSTPLHSQSLRWLNRPFAFNIFCVVAFITVLITYFGVNFILGGMHGYA